MGSKGAGRPGVKDLSEEINVHVVCVMRMSPVRSQMWGLGLLESRSSVAEMRRVSHFFAAEDWRVVLVKNSLGLFFSKG